MYILHSLGNKILKYSWWWYLLKETDHYV